MAAVDLAGLAARLHVFPHELAQACAVSARTVRRWQAQGAPAWVARVLEARAGLIPLPGWDGWRARAGGVLRDQYGVEFDVCELRALPYLRELTDELRRQLDRVTAERDALKAAVSQGARHCAARKVAGASGSTKNARMDGGGGAGGERVHHHGSATLPAGG